MIISKLQFHAEGGGERHVRDVRAMLEVAGDEIDTEFVGRWALKLGVDAVWKTVTDSAD